MWAWQSRTRLLIGLLGPTACGDPSAPPAAAADLHIVPAQLVAPGEPLRVLHDGDQVELSQAVQGGWVLYVGARVRGLDDPTARLSTRLLAPDTLEELASESRTVRLVPAPGEGGWLEPDLRTRAQVSHLVLCPNYGTRDVVDATWRLEITIADADGAQSRTTSLAITPRCTADAGGLCACECATGYVRGLCAE